MPTRASISSALRHLAPKLPLHEFEAVVDHAMDSPGLRVATPENAAFLSLVAYARHTLTEYDALLAQGYDRDSARFFVADELGELLASWGVRRMLSAECASRALLPSPGGGGSTGRAKRKRSGWGEFARYAINATSPSREEAERRRKENNP
jgi:hypothetical protein